MDMQVTFAHEKAFHVDFGDKNEFAVAFSEATLIGAGVPYDGAYEVVPAVTPQTLPTQQRYLSQDVIIREIPYFEVSNYYNGKTATIG